MNLGYSHQVIVEENQDITIEVPGPNKIIIHGCDKQKVGQFAAEVREKRPRRGRSGVPEILARTRLWRLMRWERVSGLLIISGTPPYYFLAPVLPALRRMTSSVYLMPLPSLVSASSLEKDFKVEGTKSDAAKQVGPPP